MGLCALIKGANDVRNIRTCSIRAAGHRTEVRRPLQFVRKLSAHAPSKATKRRPRRVDDVASGEQAAAIARIHRPRAYREEKRERPGPAPRAIRAFCHAGRQRPIPRRIDNAQPLNNLSPYTSHKKVRGAAGTLPLSRCRIIVRIRGERRRPTFTRGQMSRTARPVE